MAVSGTVKATKRSWSDPSCGQVIRKSNGVAQPVYHFGDIRVDLRARRILKQGREVALTRREFDMLALLVCRAGEVITRDEFLDAIWGKEVYVTHRVVDTHIAALRKKLEGDPNNPTHILGVRGVGYKLEGNLPES